MIGIVSVSVLLLVTIVSVKAADKFRVVGTEAVLAADTQDTQDTGDQQQQQPQQQDQQQSSQPSSSSQPESSPATTGSSDGGQQSQPQQAGSGQKPEDSTLVDCVGPDQKHFTTDFQSCQEFNSKWGNTNFTFTQLQQSKSGSSDNTPEPTSAPEPTEAPKQQSKVEVQTEGSKAELNLQTPTGQVQIKREDDGSIAVHVKKTDGTEVQLQQNALESLNKSLGSTGISLTSSKAGSGVAIQQGSIQAQSELPVSVDVATKKVIVTTSTGDKTLTILPAEAIAKVLKDNLVTTVSSTASDGAILQSTQITQLNNQAVFAVSGIAEKRILGLIPMGFAKTVYVSAEDGTVVSTQQAAWTKILESISF